jgi:hypothetical protein
MVLVSPHLSDLSSPTRDATFTVDGQTYRPTTCYSGGRTEYFGVDLIDDTAHVGVRVAVDPIEGARVRFARYDSSGNKLEAVPFLRQACSVLGADIRPTNLWVNEIREYSGTLEAVCVSESGVRLEAHVRFQHCH